MDQKRRQNEEIFIRRLKLIIVAVAVILFLPLLALMFYLHWRFETLEEGMSYRDPRTLNGFSAEAEALPWEPVKGQTVYVPAYSHVYHQDGKPHLLTVTLSIRNADTEHELVVTSVRYTNTKGQHIRSYLDTPLRLGPLASTEFLVERKDTTGGSGASFLVEWVAGEAIVPPVIETVMIDTDSSQGISFARPGIVIKEFSPTLPGPVEE